MFHVFSSYVTCSIIVCVVFLFLCAEIWRECHESGRECHEMSVSGHKMPRSVTRACTRSHKFCYFRWKRSLFVSRSVTGVYFLCHELCVCGLLRVTSLSHYVNNEFDVSSLLFSYSHECNMICLLLYKRFIHQAFESQILLLFLSPTTKESIVASSPSLLSFFLSKIHSLHYIFVSFSP